MVNDFTTAQSSARNVLALAKFAQSCLKGKSILRLDPILFELASAELGQNLLEIHIITSFLSFCLNYKPKKGAFLGEA